MKKVLWIIALMYQVIESYSDAKGMCMVHCRDYVYVLDGSRFISKPFGCLLVASNLIYVEKLRDNNYWLNAYNCHLLGE